MHHHTLRLLDVYEKEGTLGATSGVMIHITYEYVLPAATGGARVSAAG